MVRLTLSIWYGAGGDAVEVLRRASADLALAGVRVEELIIRFAHIGEMLSKAAAVIVVTFGVLEAFVRVLRMGLRPSATRGERKAIWRRFGIWLLLGLEFELAGDIISSVVSPTWQDIAELGAIAVIRTFLNYFLERDLENGEKSGERSTLAVGAEEHGTAAAAPAPR